MGKTIYIDDKQYHANDDGTLYLDEYGELVLSYICLCAAYSDSECCCGAWSRPLPSDDDGWLMNDDYFT